tara:strand:- start:505 stop:750 length:246 start_codon:yes stop_codon:yes gene_type:complete
MSRPLTPAEVKEAADQFFPLFDIVHRSMPENCTVEDSLKVMETVCNLAHKMRDEEKIAAFGFLKDEEETETELETNSTEDT